MSLGVSDRERVEELLSGGVQDVRTVLRALALQQLDRGLSTPAVGSVVGQAGKTVRQIGQRYLAGGLERALFDAPRPGEGFARWSVRLPAAETVRRGIVPTVNREVIRMLLESHDLKPWREKNVVRRATR